MEVEIGREERLRGEARRARAEASFEIEGVARRIQHRIVELVTAQLRALLGQGHRYPDPGPAIPKRQTVCHVADRRHDSRERSSVE